MAVFESARYFWYLAFSCNEHKESLALGNMATTVKAIITYEVIVQH